MNKPAKVTAALKVETTELKPIPVANVKLQQEGFCYRTWCVNLPAHLQARHLQENGHEIWKRVQESIKAFNVLDELVIQTADRSQLITCRVASSTRSHVAVAGLKIHSFGSPISGASWTSEDSRYRVEWLNGAYQVRDLQSDSICSAVGYQSVALAKAYVTTLYPKKETE